jgi:hypothetical protein
VTPVITSEVLRATVISRWRGELMGVQARGRAHWRTKVSYYQAVVDLLETRAQSSIRWCDVVDRVVPKGSRTTFYDVAGPNAKYPLVGVLLRNTDPQVTQLGWIYQRSDAIAQLIDEAKVWSYWLYRDVFLERMRSGADAEMLLRRSVIGWSLDHPALAAASRYAPPACAVEDLIAVRGGGVTPAHAYQALAATAFGSLRRVVSDRTAGHGVRRVEAARVPVPA